MSTSFDRLVRLGNNDRSDLYRLNPSQDERRESPSGFERERVDLLYGRVIVDMVHMRARRVVVIRLGVRFNQCIEVRMDLGGVPVMRVDVLKGRQAESQQHTADRLKRQCPSHIVLDRYVPDVKP